MLLKFICRGSCRVSFILPTWRESNMRSRVKYLLKMPLPLLFTIWQPSLTHIYFSNSLSTIWWVLYMIFFWWCLVYTSWSCTDLQGMNQFVSTIVLMIWGRWINHDRWSITLMCMPSQTANAGFQNYLQRALPCFFLYLPNWSDNNKS